jgi:hypothetical protein
LKECETYSCLAFLLFFGQSIKFWYTGSAFEPLRKKASEFVHRPFIFGKPKRLSQRSEDSNTSTVNPTTSAQPVQTRPSRALSYLPTLEQRKYLLYSFLKKFLVVQSHIKNTSFHFRLQKRNLSPRSEKPRPFIICHHKELKKVLICVIEAILSRRQTTIKTIPNFFVDN